MRSQLSSLSLLLVAGTFAAPALAYDVDVLQDNGDPANRIDLVILGDGYRAQDQDKLSSDVASFLEEFWSESPYGEYRDFFNVTLVHVVSNENGADRGTYGAERDTALGAYYFCYDVERLICLDYGAAYQVASEHAPQYDHLFVIVNDPKYGGAGGQISVFSVDGNAGEIAEHEFGHTLGGLTDEYEDPYPAAGYCPALPQDCREPNATQITERDQTKWGIWIEDTTPLPTTSADGNVIGLFEGCRYVSDGVYRPRNMCKMRALGAGFCEICGEALILSTYSAVDPIDGASPASPVTLDAGQSATLTLDRPTPEPDTVEVDWTVDGVGQPESGSSYRVWAEDLGLGAHEVQAALRDGTTWVRRDPLALLQAAHTWTVQVRSVLGEGELPEREPDAAADADESLIDVADADAAAEADRPGTETEGACVPGSRSCGGIYQVLVCLADGSGWEEDRLCYAAEPCRDGECQALDGGDDFYCGCGGSGQSGGELAVLLVLLGGLVFRRRRA